MQEMLYTAEMQDRQHHVRRDQAQLQRLQRAENVRVVPLWRELSLLHQDHPGQPWLQGAAAHDLLNMFPAAIFLGIEDGAPFFALDISAMAADECGPVLAPRTAFAPLRPQAGNLPMAAGAWLAYGRGMVAWHRVSRFCSVCGHETGIAEGGHVRRCSNPSCGHATYPRTDPAVIMLVQDGDRILLHRQAAWPEGMWSCLAGFVEPGETLEHAVWREVQEESGIQVADVRYVRSQPWPFPSSLMIAFTAQAVGGELRPDLSEIQDARWFGLDDLQAFDDDHRQTGHGPFLAMPGSAARYLIEGWKARMG